MNILVIAAHPDDEVLGCGGTIAKHSKNGEKVSVHILAEGITSRFKHRNREKNKNELDILGKAAEKANSILGVSNLKLHQFPDNRMDSLDRLDVIKVIEEIIETEKPDIIYTHHIGDVNVDHQVIHQAVVTATRPIPGNHQIRKLLFFEVLSSTEWQISGSAPPFQPNYFVDVSNTIALKLKALQEYDTEMKKWPHSRSIEGAEYLAKIRGCQSGLDVAEAFILGRNIIL